MLNICTSYYNVYLKVSCKHHYLRYSTICLVLYLIVLILSQFLVYFEFHVTA